MAGIMEDETLYIEYVKEKTKQDNVVLVDVGFNLGDFTDVFLGIFPDAEVFGFEPNIDAYNSLPAKLAENKNVHLFNVGIANTLLTKRQFYYMAPNTGCSSFYYRDNFGPRSSVTTAHLIALEVVDLPAEITYLKIDTEGYEIEVMKSAQVMMKNRRIKFIQFEAGDCTKYSGYKLGDIIYFLNDLGYVVYNKNFTMLSPDVEFDGTIVENYLAELI